MSAFDRVEKWLPYLALAGVAYAGYKLISKVGGAAASAAQSIISAPGQFGSAVGIQLYDWIHPNTAGESLFYVVNFPDGTRHAIGASTVADDGGFSYDNIAYVMKNDAAGNHYAVED